MNLVLDKIRKSFKLHDEDSAFDLLSGVIILKKSAVNVFSNNWIKMKNNDGTLRNSNKDGKIDLIDITVDHSIREINVKFIQVQKSKSMGSDKIRLFVRSAKDYFIDLKNIDDDDYIDLRDKQKELKRKQEEYSNYSLRYSFYISYLGKINRSEKLEQFVNELDLSNTYNEVYNNKKLNEGLDEIKRISSEPADIDCNIESSKPLIEESNNKFSSFTLLLNSKEIKSIIEMEQMKNIELNRLFNNNVRGFLEDSSINCQIKDTIVKHSNSFYYCNNGATIFCDKIEKQNKKKIHVVNPRIINGQQSVASMYLYDKTNKVNILVKFVSVKEAAYKDEMMNLLCRTTNTSNQIKPINLISNSKLVIETKQLFKDKGIGLNIKEGALLNNIFVDNSDIDLEELLKIWATLFMERPDYAKAKGKVVNIFYKAELDEDNYKILKDDKTINLIKSQFYFSFKFLESVKNVINKLSNKEYFTHGYYVILFIIYKKYGIQLDAEKINIEQIDSEIESYIDAYKNEMTLNGKSYSLNNYFKGTRPLKDMGMTIITESSFIRNIENAINE